jgi:protein-L-isoaspartate(D-aspartate) O-methyltransferase
MLQKNKNIVEYLINERACNEKIVEIIGKLDRKAFLPKESQHLELTLKPIPLGYGQTMSAPFIVASMTELLEVNTNQKILEIGSGCAYQTAILLELGADVFSIEYVPELAEFGRENLKKMGYNPNIINGDGFYGWPDQAPFDRIIIAACLPKMPENLIKQLKNGGIMLMPMKKNDKEFMVKVRKKSSAIYDTEWLYGVRFVPFVGDINTQL